MGQKGPHPPFTDSAPLTSHGLSTHKERCEACPAKSVYVCPEQHCQGGQAFKVLDLLAPSPKLWDSCQNGKDCDLDLKYPPKLFRGKAFGG